MHTHHLYDKVGHILQELVIRPVVVTPSIAVFETHSQADSDKCLALIPDHRAHTTSLDGMFFVAVTLAPIHTPTSVH